MRFLRRNFRPRLLLQNRYKIYAKFRTHLRCFRSRFTLQSARARTRTRTRSSARRYTWLGLPILMEAQGSNYHPPIYIYIYCIYILHLGAFNIENAPRPNLCARSEPTVPPRPVSSLPHAPDRTFSFSRPRPSFSVNGSSANGSTSSHKLQSHQTCSCNYTRQQLQSLFCLTDFWT